MLYKYKKILENEITLQVPQNIKPYRHTTNSTLNHAAKSFAISAGIAIPLAISFLAGHKQGIDSSRKQIWLSKGCSSIKDQKWKAKCEKYLASQKKGK